MTLDENGKVNKRGVAYSQVGNFMRNINCKTGILTSKRNDVEYYDSKFDVTIISADAEFHLGNELYGLDLHKQQLLLMKGSATNYNTVK